MLDWQNLNQLISKEIIPVFQALKYLLSHVSPEIRPTTWWMITSLTNSPSEDVYNHICIKRSHLEQRQNCMPYKQIHMKFHMKVQENGDILIHMSV